MEKQFIEYARNLKKLLGCGVNDYIHWGKAPNDRSLRVYINNDGTYICLELNDIFDFRIMVDRRYSSTDGVELTFPLKNGVPTDKDIQKWLKLIKSKLTDETAAIKKRVLEDKKREMVQLKKRLTELKVELK